MTDDQEEKEPSHALPLSFYRDPLEHLIAQEARTCTGCVYETRIFGTTYCARGKKHGRRCKHYEERAGVPRRNVVPNR
jgi:hypothetical protein